MREQNRVGRKKVSKAEHTGIPIKLVAARGSSKPRTAAVSRKLPPDQDGLFKRAAARGEKMLKTYSHLNPEAEGHFMVNLMLNLICLSERSPGVGDPDQELVEALGWYQDFAAEKMWAEGWYDSLEAARGAIEEMMLSRHV